MDVAAAKGRRQGKTRYEKVITMRAIRRTVRSAAIATGVIAATLALPVGVKAGAEGGKQPDTVMMAAGGGMAAAGAAGLGFAMLRRRRTDGEG